MNINIQKESDTHYTVWDDAGIKIIDTYLEKDDAMFHYLSIRYQQLEEYRKSKNGLHPTILFVDEAKHIQKSAK